MYHIAFNLILLNKIDVYNVFFVLLIIKLLRNNKSILGYGYYILPIRYIWKYKCM